jgi:DNA-binding beta-propeller fold protein YncE
MRLYVRKDIVSQVWNLGASSTTPKEIIADPYEGKGISLSTDQILGGDGQLNLPRSLAVASDGSIYVSDTGNHRILHMTNDGDVLHTWGIFTDGSQVEGGAPPGTFYEPWGIAIGPEGSVYVADTWNHRVQKFSSDGQFLTQWGSFGQAETGTAFWGPRDIAVDESGRVLVTDTGNKRIVIFDLDGNYITEFGGAGLLAGQFDEPVSLAVDEDGLIYVTDTWNQRIQVFSPDSQGIVYTPIKEWNIAGWYGQSMDNKPFIQVARNGGVFVSDPEGYRILEFNKQGDFIRYWGDYGNTPDTFILPTGMSVDLDGGLWVADTGNHRILYFTIPEIDTQP